MSRLIGGMFNGADPETSLFGLRSGDYKDPHDFIHNGGWYNTAGEELGQGDLSTDDLSRIAKGLEENELFIILLERDRWGYRALSDAPYPDYVANACVMILAPGTIYLTQPNLKNLIALDSLARSAWAGNVNISILPRKEARKMLLGHNGTRLDRFIYHLKERLGRN
jgi:hypothetical protein